jgi:hypothetical protein
VARKKEFVVIPAVHPVGVFINDILTVRLCRSVGRPGSRGNGFAMWSYNVRPLGWIDDGHHLIECVVASQLVNGELAARWEEIPNGLRLIHPRYTLSVEQNSSGWVPKITDEVSGKSHSLKPRGLKFEAINLLDHLLRRRVGRERPDFDLLSWTSHDDNEIDERRQFQLALRVIAPHLRKLVVSTADVEDHQIAKARASAAELAKLLDGYYCGGLDPIPLLGTILATYIKSTLIDLYRGVAHGLVGPYPSVLLFTKEELASFRDRFRRSPMTDDKYLEFVDRHFIFSVRLRRRKCRSGRPASNKSYRPKLCPRRHRGDYPIAWPWPSGARLWGRDCLRP